MVEGAGELEAKLGEIGGLTEELQGRSQSSCNPLGGNTSFMPLFCFLA
ncbi:hypothetical protein [Rhizobium sp. BK661]|nr:hypothetical protein [Rhizobium sp. BK661]MCS3742135.1 hypothetical protein [Rhizobium sp. BK661]